MNTKHCPFCCEEVLAAAVKCKHCHEFIVDEFPEHLLKKRHHIQVQLGGLPGPVPGNVQKPMGAPVENPATLWRGGPSILHWTGPFIRAFVMFMLGVFLVFGGALLGDAGIKLMVPLTDNLDIMEILRMKYIAWVGLGVVGLSILSIAKTWFAMLGAGKYTVTETRISERIGLISNKTNEIRIADIRGINIRQTVTQRILGLGTLEIGSAASAAQEIHFRGIRNPNRVRDIIIEAQNKVA